MNREIPVLVLREAVGEVPMAYSPGRVGRGQGEGGDFEESPLPYPSPASGRGDEAS